MRAGGGDEPINVEYWKRKDRRSFGLRQDLRTQELGKARYV